jgi:glycine/D-amino acid oxidase-like deaminating enzyme
MPTFYFELREPSAESPRSFYGFPSLDGKSLKVGEHSGGAVVADALQVDRTLRESDVAPIADFLNRCMPGVSRRPVRHSVCLYTVTPDRHFIVDRHPEFPNVAIGCGFSGHGFKFTSVLGDALAELVLTGQTAYPIEFLSLKRLQAFSTGATP